MDGSKSNCELHIRVVKNGAGTETKYVEKAEDMKKQE